MVLYAVYHMQHNRIDIKGEYWKFSTSYNDGIFGAHGIPSGIYKANIYHLRGYIDALDPTSMAIIFHNCCHISKLISFLRLGFNTQTWIS